MRKITVKPTPELEKFLHVYVIKFYNNALSYHDFIPENNEILIKFQIHDRHSDKFFNLFIDLFYNEPENRLKNSLTEIAGKKAF